MIDFPPGFKIPQRFIPDQTPHIVTIFQEIGVRAQLRDFRCLDVFAGVGNELSKWIGYVDSVDAWEINRKKADTLMDKIPRADVSVLDSYVAIKSPEFNKYDLIFIDNNIMQADHIEHFDLFPDVIDKLKYPGYIILNVLSDPEPYYKAHGGLADPRLCRLGRFNFYNKSTLPMDEIVRTYHHIARKRGDEMTWHKLQKRSSNGVHYLAMEFN